MNKKGFTLANADPQSVLSLCVEEKTVPARSLPQSPRAPHRDLTSFSADFPSMEVGHRGLAIHSDCFEWLRRIPEASIHAVVTDPPYGVKEFDADQLTKRDVGVGGILAVTTSVRRQQTCTTAAFHGSQRKRAATLAAILHRVVNAVASSSGAGRACVDSTAPGFGDEAGHLLSETKAASMAVETGGAGPRSGFGSRRLPR